MQNNYSDKMNLIEQLKNLGLVLPYSENLDIYHTPLSLYGKIIHNRLGIQPLEGFDSNTSGGPTDMVYRRYLRFVKGGAGLIWFEACAVSDDGKSNPFQMSLNDNNVSDFQKLINEMDKDKCCIGCNNCFKLMDGHTMTGCIIRDKEIYLPLYQKYVLDR